MGNSYLYGIFASSVLFGIYLVVLTLVSGWNYALDQFASYWYFIVSLVVGFGIQVALYRYLRNLVQSGQGAAKVVGVSGATSTAAMISCCTHYLVNILPILGITGIVTFVSQYQIKIFWFGLVANIFGIVYITSKIIRYKRHT